MAWGLGTPALERCNLPLMEASYQLFVMVWEPSPLLPHLSLYDVSRAFPVPLDCLFQTANVEVLQLLFIRQGLVSTGGEAMCVSWVSRE